MYKVDEKRPLAILCGKGDSVNFENTSSECVTVRTACLLVSLVFTVLVKTLHSSRKLREG